MAKSTNPVGVVALLAIGALGVGALGFYVANTPGARQVPAELRRTDEKEIREGTRRPKPTLREHTQPTHVVKLPKSLGAALALDEEATVPAGEDPRTFVARHIWKMAGADGRVLSVDVREGIATVALNEAAATGLGSDQEGELVDGLVLAFGQFSEVRQIKLEVDGKPFPSGHFDFSDPLDVKREASPPASSSSPAEASEADPASTPSEP